MKQLEPMTQAEVKDMLTEYVTFQNILLRLTENKYIVSFDSHNGLIQISVQPCSTGLGASITINKDANWFDALKSLELKLLP